MEVPQPRLHLQILRSRLWQPARNLSHLRMDHWKEKGLCQGGRRTSGTEVIILFRRTSVVLLLNTPLFFLRPHPLAFIDILSVLCTIDSTEPHLSSSSCSSWEATYTCCSHLPCCLSQVLSQKSMLRSTLWTWVRLTGPAATEPWHRPWERMAISTTMPL